MLLPALLLPRRLEATRPASRRQACLSAPRRLRYRTALAAKAGSATRGRVASKLRPSRPCIPALAAWFGSDAPSRRGARRVYPPHVVFAIGQPLRPRRGARREGASLPNYGRPGRASPPWPLGLEATRPRVAAPGVSIRPTSSSLSDSPCGQGGERDARARRFQIGARGRVASKLRRESASLPNWGARARRFQIGGGARPAHFHYSGVMARSKAERSRAALRRRVR